MVKLITIHFQEKNPDRRGIYERMLQALNRSVEVNSPSTPLEIVRFTEDWKSRAANQAHPNQDAQQSFVDNTNKMRAWQEVISQHKDGDILVVIDCDTLVLRGLGDAEDALEGCDIGFTFKRKGSAFPFNSGVVVAKVNEKTREFFKKWREVNEVFLSDGKTHEKFRSQFGGINQAALGYMLKSNQVSGLSIKKLHCQEWNCEDSEWINLDENTRILHIKSQLREACLHDRWPCVWSKKEKLFKAFEQFKKYDERETNDSGNEV